MIKILIVDDEALARYAFRTLISRNFAEIEIVGDADSGSKAIEMARTLRPDIIAMDIKMPGINGIEASEAILKELPDINIIILTAYDNFNYVQKALDIGVKGYLLKPFRNDEVVKKINNIISSIDNDKNQESFKQQVESKIRIVKPFIEKELISAIISGSADVNEISSYSSFLQEDFNSGYFMLVTFGFKASKSINDSVRNKIFRDKVTEVLERHLPLMKKCIFGNSIGNMLVAFFPSPAQEKEDIIISEAMVIAKELKRRISVITGIDTAIGLGKPYKGVENLKKSYYEAYSAIKEAEKDNSVKFSRIIAGDTEQVCQSYPLNLENDLIDELRTGNISRSKELVHELTAFFRVQCIDTESLRELINQFIAILKRTVLQMGAGVDRLMELGRTAEIGSIENPEELIIWCKHTALAMIEMMEPLKPNRDAGKMRKVHEYIKTHLLTDITLEMTAEEAGMSPQYLSRMFKEETGLNFVEYITQKRINYAKELMKTDSRSIGEISKLAGYADVNYFSRIFKKSTGVTPTQYKDRL